MRFGRAVHRQGILIRALQRSAGPRSIGSVTSDPTARDLLERRLGRKLMPGETAEGPGHLHVQRPAQVEMPAPAAAELKASERRRRQVEEFSLTPRQVKDHLDSVVVSQDNAKMALAVAICDHYNFVRRCLQEPEVAERHHLKPNIMLLGPSGVGKTHLIRAAAELLNVPFVRADATRFSATGYAGADVDDLVRSLLPAADGDATLAEYGERLDSLYEYSQNCAGAIARRALLPRVCAARVPSQASCTWTRWTNWQSHRLGRAAEA